MYYKDMELRDPDAEILKALKEAFPDCWFKPGDDFDPGADISRAVWSGEGSYLEDEEGYMVDTFNSWDESYNLGVHPHIDDFVTELGYYWEAYDGGTYFLYRMEQD